ncbi:hypothetical protein Q1695_006010 [Nippostrongylus brasiliensis]|nr:hypothetical protein Q1695_006010 [Nippostrongylus brasiliensis]
MARILQGLEDNCLAYLDDIIVFDKDFDSHLLSLRKVFERFRMFNIKASDGSAETEDIVEFPVCLALDPAAPPVRIRPYDILIEQKQDSFCRGLMQFLETDSLPDDFTEEQKSATLELAPNCIIRNNGCLYYQSSALTNPSNLHPALFLPDKLREPVCIAFHSSSSAGGHFGWKKTFAKIKPCQRKRSHGATREKMIPVHANAIFHKVYLDLSGPYSVTEASNKYILCLIDHFAKFVVAAPLPDCRADTVAHVIMNNCILQYGAMTELISDNASYLKGDLMTELGKLLRIERYFCTPYHYEGNGACERMFATFQMMLRPYISKNHLDWDRFLPSCVFCYNTSVHTSTDDTPFFLMFGRDPIFSVDLIIKDKTVPHFFSDDDAAVYKESLLSALHSAWSLASQHNTRQSAAYKAQYDKSGTGNTLCKDSAARL